MTNYDRGKRTDNGEQNMKEKATIFDYARLCKFYDDCAICPLECDNNSKGINCDYIVRAHPDKANEIIINWRKEHPIKTRQSEFLKMFPNAMKDGDVINIDPCVVDETLHLASTCWECAKKNNVEDCEECRKNYWLAEVDE